MSVSIQKMQLFIIRFDSFHLYKKQLKKNPQTFLVFGGKWNAISLRFNNILTFYITEVFM